MSLPAPIPGLVLYYSYLWAREHERGAEEGLKARPAVIVAARRVVEGREVITVVPITHTPPREPADAIEIPPSLKTHLGLDEQPSWVIVTETNDFLWPGVDLRPVPGIKPTRFSLGILPPRFFAHVRDKILQAHLQRKLARVPRAD